jgi:hypothetical protein
MSTITFAKLDSSRPTNGYVDFKATVDVKFASHEINSLWEIEMQLWEDDTLSDDKLGGPVRRSFTSVKQDMKVEISRRLRTTTVGTELGDEEVFGTIKVRPLNTPPAFVTSTAKTGIQVVNV